ncbi:MAG: MerR family transcriptional regulator [Microbacteriaceae bacterium]|nr:MerR family transcriptional regulator [Microbacteriaceae bacterium]
MENIDPDFPFLTIAAAAELARMHPQTLRQYDRMGLVKPSRTSGQSRRYTLRNVAQLAEVAKLSQEGVSLVAIKRILELENLNSKLRQENIQQRKIIEKLLASKAGARVFAVGEAETVILPSGKRPKRSTAVVLWRQR